MSPTFADIPAGAEVFLDANIFVYAHCLHPRLGPPSRELLERIERQDVSGFTSAPVLAETVHRLMTLEACTTFGWSFAGITRRLRRHPEQIRTLTLFRQALEDILRSSVHVLSLEASLIAEAADASVGVGLLTNDALVVAIMQRHSLTQLASHDVDFDRVPGIDRYAPV